MTTAISRMRVKAALREKRQKRYFMPNEKYFGEAINLPFSPMDMLVNGYLGKTAATGMYDDIAIKVNLPEDDDNMTISYIDGDYDEDGLYYPIDIDPSLDHNSKVYKYDYSRSLRENAQAAYDFATLEIDDYKDYMNSLNED
jgi:hypothetical protein